MIGVLTALTLALPQAGTFSLIVPGSGDSPPVSVDGRSVPFDGSSGPFDGSSGPVDGSSGPTDAFEQLRRLSCARQQAGAEVPWSQVNALLGRLTAELQGEFEPGQGEFEPGQGNAQACAGLLQDLAIGTTGAQRFDLVRACEGMLSLTRSNGDRRHLLSAQVALLEPLVANAGGGAPVPRRAAALYERVAAALTDASTGEVPRFMRRSRLRLERLGLGAAMPRFVARDTGGNELRSAQLEGEVLVLRFWDPSSPASLVAHRADSGLVREFWDAPFHLIGVTRNEDRDTYLRLIETARFSGVQLFDGPISGALADALEGSSWGGLGAFGGTSGPGPKQRLSNRWGRPAPGSLFVVDARGRIRGRDLPPEATRALVKKLIDEEQFRRREQLMEGARAR